MDLEEHESPVVGEAMGCQRRRLDSDAAERLDGIDVEGVDLQGRHPEGERWQSAWE